MNNADLMEIYKFLEVYAYKPTYIHTYIHYLTVVALHLSLEIYKTDFQVSGVKPGPLVLARVHE